MNQGRTHPEDPEIELTLFRALASPDLGHVTG